MEDSRFQQLHTGHREVLRLRLRRLPAKEIAVLVGVTENTVNRYLTEASGILDAGGRDGAARALAAHEATYQDVKGRFSVGDDSLVLPAAPVVAVVQPKPSFDWRALLPLRLGADHNDLPVLARFIWIVVLAALLAVGFGAVAGGVRVVDDLARGHGRR